MPALYPTGVLGGPGNGHARGEPVIPVAWPDFSPIADRVRVSPFEFCGFFFRFGAKEKSHRKEKRVAVQQQWDIQKRTPAKRL